MELMDHGELLSRLHGCLLKTVRGTLRKGGKKENNSEQKYALTNLQRKYCNKFYQSIISLLFFTS